ncbi:MAG: hypothetical protein LDL23_06370 [Flavobacterium sp.]|uniref:DUF6705 family protein n=1 Tax=Flavobacterium sp. TaxID=239 RepID=UPI0025C7346F|nr:DUF6705 family protein [Flavobacterium sp.]MCA1966259.1 hypothetical protein [Flavobacterium sp.]
MMKNLNILVVLLLSINCKAQTPIVDISESEMGLPNGYYIKDLLNLLNPFEGTYVYTNGADTLKIVLVKKVLQYNSQYYEDLIIGEYQYIENGVEKANTLPNVNITYLNQRRHNIDGNFLVDKNFRVWQCPDCSATEKRLNTLLKDVVSGRFADLIMRRTTEGGQEVMKINITNISRVIEIEGQPTAPDFALPIGEFTLIKQ